MFRLLTHGTRLEFDDCPTEEAAQNGLIRGVILPGDCAERKRSLTMTV